VHGDGLGDALTACQARADELPSVALVDLRAGRADGFAPVAARDMQHSPRLARRVVDRGNLARGQVDGPDGAPELDRVRAGAGSSELMFPGAEVGPGDGVVGGRSRPRTLRAGGEGVRRGGGQMPLRGSGADSKALRAIREAGAVQLAGRAVIRALMLGGMCSVHWHGIGQPIMSVIEPSSVT
jgi:hypothetical protein